MINWILCWLVGHKWTPGHVWGDFYCTRCLGIVRWKPDWEAKATKSQWKFAGGDKE